MSIGQAGMIIAWLWQGRYRERLKTLVQNRQALAFAGIYLIFLVGLIQTSDFAYAWKDLRIKLPILLLPLLIASMPPLGHRHTLRFIHVIFGSCAVVCIIGLMIYIGLIPRSGDNYREISPFISHIRLSTILVWCFFTAVWITIRPIPENHIPRWVYTGLAIFFLFFLLLLKSFTGLIVFSLMLIFVCIWTVVMAEKRSTRTITASIIIIFSGMLIYLVGNEYQRHFRREKIDLSRLPATTRNGNTYKYYPEDTYTENGYYFWMYIAPYELKTEWEKRSKIPYSGTTENGYPLDHMLIKFITSKGWRKNGAAVIQLTDEEIRAIEKGTPNYLYMNPWDIRWRIYETIREIDHYRRTGDPNYQSVSTRLEMWKIGTQVMISHWFSGVGTGDVPKAMREAYKRSDTQLEEKFWMNPHQQYITIGIATGIAGLLVFLALFLYPFTSHKNRNNLPWVFIFMISLMAMLDEDTLETQAGVTQVAFLYCILLWGTTWKKPTDA